ncbi:larval cuticle protein 4-like [Musca vetustissima]|uniref:larval cuticle protein 4-like n=1 Tax=Musca vetustissima TaxID=27455 RepID=UPI002AB64F47|nr:larval cuticle protein 4-like [Musca vetustissima]
MFKFVVLCALIATAAAVQKQGARHHGVSSKHYSAPGGATSDDAHAEVTRYAADVNEHGFEYAFDTTNAIHATASGNANGEHKGDFAWISPEGEHISVQYVADENGYQPSSDLLPTPPPVPAAILKALEYIRTHPQYEESAPKTLVKQSIKSVSHKAVKGRRF